MEFKPFPKIPRLSREIVVTEKIDGTNASVYIEPVHMLASKFHLDYGIGPVDGHWLFAGSRTRWLNTTSAGDNYGFAKWVAANAKELLKLGPGHHFGEWWGFAIQRGYNLSEKRFSLFNVSKWSDPNVRPKCCHVVPVLWQGPFYTSAIDAVVETMRVCGSLAAPGFQNPEGVVVYHTAGNLLFKKTLKDDEKPKGQ